jgi:hypothetical protein
MPSRLGFRPLVLYFEACLGDIVPASSEKYRAIWPSSSEWPHVFTLFLRPLQPLAQALDVFIVRLVLLFLHFPATPARLRRDAFSPSHAQRVRTRVQQYGIGLFS